MFAYSVWFSRRMTARPYVSFRVFSASTICLSIQSSSCLGFLFVWTTLVGRRHRAGPDLLGHLEPLVSILRLAKIA